MTETLTETEVGILETFNVYRGDVKIVIDSKDPDSVGKARTMITDMLHRGYAIFVTKPDGKLARVKQFKPQTMEYIVAETGNPKDDRRLSVTKTRGHVTGRPSGG